jgi:hypothetical protein
MPKDVEIAAKFKKEVLSIHPTVYLRHTGCADTKKHSGAACDAARGLVESKVIQHDFSRLVLSVVSDLTAMERL